jgi:hypothetical protein|tara:strand:- start:241 stop:480 length:240 start_codon:yes stop_codon:yes gene_type:complete
MSSFKKWWKLNGQGIGFIVGIVYLNAYFLLLGDRIQAGDLTADLLAGGWIVQFFGFAVWYAWQMKVHGWRLPKHIKDTH